MFDLSYKMVYFRYEVIRLDSLADLFAHLLASNFSSEISGADAVVKDLVHCILNSLRSLGTVKVIAEHHGSGEDGGEGIGLVRSGDVRSGSVDGLKDAGAGGVADGSGREHAEGADEHGGLIRQDVSEDVSGDHHIELLRVADKLHGSVVDIHVRELDVRIVLVGLDHNVAPQLADVQHVRLVNRADPLAPLPGDVEGNLGDSLDLALLVAHVVVPEPLAVLGGNALGLSEVDVSRQLPHNHDVDPTDNLGLESRSISKLGKNSGRAKVGEETQRLPHLQKSSLRTLVTRIGIPLGASDGGEEDRVARLHLLQSLVGKGIVAGVKGSSSDEGLLELDLEPLLGRDSLADFHSG
mmetsp:Transcript_26553/g.87214  ORF Transcript_26553/g.87214 Transcript_26553/m.87214 type:complete len:353 (-) Transcript_26553:226-1284(-)